MHRFPYQIRQMRANAPPGPGPGSQHHPIMRPNGPMPPQLLRRPNVPKARPPPPPPQPQYRVTSNNQQITHAWNYLPLPEPRREAPDLPTSALTINPTSLNFFQLKWSPPGPSGQPIPDNAPLQLSQNGNLYITGKIYANGLILQSNDQFQEINLEQLRTIQTDPNSDPDSDSDSDNDTVITAANLATLPSSSTTTNEVVQINPLYSSAPSETESVDNNSAASPKTSFTHRALRFDLQHLIGTSVSLIMRKGFNSAMGSAAFIRADGWAMTAAHCVLDNNRTNRMDEIWGLVYNKQQPTLSSWIKADRWFVDAAADIAAIHFPGIENQPFLQWTTNDVNMCDPCYIMGDPIGADFNSFSRGIVRDPHYTDPYGYGPIDQILIDSPGFGGNSGSPILNQRGEIIGVYTWGYSDGESMGGGANHDMARSVVEWMIRNQRDYVAKRYMGISWRHPDAFELSNYYPMGNQYPAQGLVITRCDATAPLYKAGLRVGDLLLSVRGQPVGVLPNERAPCAITWLETTDVTVHIEWINTMKQHRDIDVLLNMDYSGFVSRDAPLAGNLTGDNLTGGGIGILKRPVAIRSARYYRAGTIRK